MKPLHLPLLLIAAGIVALWLGERVLATGCLIAVMGWLWHRQRSEGSREAQAGDVMEVTTDDRIPYPYLILAAMDWAACGKTAWVPEDEDPQHPHLLYVGYHVPSGLGQGQTFLPELEITARNIQPVYGVGAAASREA